LFRALGSKKKQPNKIVEKRQEIKEENNLKEDGKAF
jgi:hypothetical protein